ncbi:hypothetical protein BGK67_35365 (plasmid) [Streptomyces subrutilus]|uniref:Uncharacterized protein n=1 Tax=Streptomyces subrutilus TaxID=36818 RepID=A0A1E5NXF5_9ACTN|nr:hypothetical protein BGK67_35365 [Streptomyces subrutilus]
MAGVQAVVTGGSPRSVGHPSGYQDPGGGRQDGPLRGRASAILAAPTSLLVGRSCPTDRGEPPPTGWGVAEAARPAAARRGGPALTCGNVTQVTHLEDLLSWTPILE